MTPVDHAERRRTPRVPLPPEEQCVFQVRTRVRLLDISLSGALVSSDIPVPPGSSGQLRFALAGSSYAPAVQVRRRAPGTDADLRLGTMFTSMDDISRRRLEDFLRKAMP